MTTTPSLTLIAIEHKVRRFWAFFSEQQGRGKSYQSAMRIAHQKLAPELKPLSVEDRQSILRAIELSE